MHASDNVMKVLVGNKADMSDRRVRYEEGEALAKEMGVPFFETSAKTGQNVEEMFQVMAEEIKRRLDQE